MNGTWPSYVNLPTSHVLQRYYFTNDQSVERGLGCSWHGALRPSESLQATNAIWLYPSSYDMVEAGFRVSTQASGQMSVCTIRVLGRCVGKTPLPALSTNENGLILLGHKAMTIETFHGLLSLRATLVLLPPQPIFLSPEYSPLIILVPSTFALNSHESQCTSTATHNSCNTCMARFMATTDTCPRPGGTAQG